MIVNILTLFPEFFSSPLKTSLIDKAQKKGLLKINVINLRDFTRDRHRQCDDKPYGGGAGMVMMIEPIFKALKAIKKKQKKNRVLFVSPQGTTLNDEQAQKLAKCSSLTLLCGHYEGVDNRVIEQYVDEEISIGDYILTGGEIASLVILDAISRYIPGFVQKEESVYSDTFRENLLKYPQYTRPPVFKGFAVPRILLSGDHKKVKEFREKERIRVTKKKRPDLYKKYIKKRCQSERANKGN
ncbi:MAG: tRNA (guanosine(37)-N1)-methyltransferase TrmD [Spirochaetes bacterium]|nr:tRNA (guanosine(37)-N1)-methyltransferase TrmD [Spirochaetota bacterium]